MTGYGRGLAEREGRRAVVEIRSVNHRFMDVKLRGAPLDAALEEKISARVRERVSRGSITVSIRLDGIASAPGVRVDLDAARRAHAELAKLASHLELGEVPLALVCAQPGVLVSTEADRSSESAAECTCAALDGALDDLVSMRDAEGDALARDLLARLDTLAALAAELKRHAASAPQDADRRLRERLARLLSGGTVTVDEARLAQEVAILAERMDVTEELVRVESHIAQAGELMRRREQAVGRRLDFLVQELGREFNTVASKSQSADTTRLVVEAKAELEKVREQVQNIE